jgi:hypothetical protein
VETQDRRRGNGPLPAEVVENTGSMVGRTGADRRGGGRQCRRVAGVLGPF